MSCGNDDSNITPDNRISFDDETFDFFGDGMVSDIRQNSDGSYQLGLSLYFGDSSMLTVVLNATDDRIIETGSYRWSSDQEAYTINSFMISSETEDNVLSFTRGTFIVERNDDLYSFTFDLLGDVNTTGSFVGNFVFPARYERGNGSFVLERTSYDIPYFGLSNILQIDEDKWLARLYFYNVDPLDPYIRDQRTHSSFLTIVQSTDEGLIEGTYEFSEESVEGTLIDGWPVIGDTYELVGGSASFTRTRDGYDVTFNLEIFDNSTNRTVEGTYSGPLNGW